MCDAEPPADLTPRYVINVEPLDLPGTVECGEDSVAVPRDDLARPGQQGFVDITLPDPHGVATAYAFEIETMDGHFVLGVENLWLQGPGVFVAVCNARDGIAQNRITVTADRACDAAGDELETELPCGDGCSAVFDCIGGGDSAVAVTP